MNIEKIRKALANPVLMDMLQRAQQETRHWADQRMGRVARETGAEAIGFVREALSDLNAAPQEATVACAHSADYSTCVYCRNLSLHELAPAPQQGELKRYKRIGSSIYREDNVRALDGATFYLASDVDARDAARGATPTADAIARAIFSIGDEPDDKVQRIEFRGGEYTIEGDKETRLGGLSERALTHFLEHFLGAAPQQKEGEA